MVQQWAAAHHIDLVRQFAEAMTRPTLKGRELVALYPGPPGFLQFAPGKRAAHFPGRRRCCSLLTHFSGRCRSRWRWFDPPKTGSNVVRFAQPAQMSVLIRCCITDSAPHFRLFPIGPARPAGRLPTPRRHTPQIPDRKTSPAAQTD
jgi:hypothetical protein